MSDDHTITTHPHYRALMTDAGIDGAAYDSDLPARQRATLY
ncbi:MAG TPA: hypothetical protein VF169_19015 [Albitalea sp.]